MSGETEVHVSGWTVDTLHVHMQNKVDDLSRMMERRIQDMTDNARLALEAQKEATAKAEVATEKRFESVNEFRSTLSDQTARFMPRNEVDARLNALTEKFDTEAVRAATSRAELAHRLDISQGQAGGQDRLWSALVGIAVVMGSVVSLIIAFRH